MNAPPGPIPNGPGKLSEHLRFIYEELRKLQPIFAPGQTGARTTRGVNLDGGKPTAASAPLYPKALFVRTIGIDAMWVSRPTGVDQSTYWAVGDADQSEHYFCLKPFELQNRYWWDESGSVGILNLKYGIDDTNVDEVTGPTETVGTGNYTAPTSRRLFGTDTQTIDPPIATNEQTTYVGTTVVMGMRIPKGLLVCNEKGKVVWDAFDIYTIGDKPETLPKVLTWAYDDPSGPQGFTSPPKPGNYDVEFIDMNTDGRHWQTQPDP